MRTKACRPACGWPTSTLRPAAPVQHLLRPLRPLQPLPPPCCFLPRFSPSWPPWLLHRPPTAGHRRQRRHMPPCLRRRHCRRLPVMQRCWQAAVLQQPPAMSPPASMMMLILHGDEQQLALYSPQSSGLQPAASPTVRPKQQAVPMDWRWAPPSQLYPRRCRRKMRERKLCRTDIKLICTFAA